MKGSVTIATNMAGRGTDIKLGDGVKELGGLFIIGTERHEARRIDNQLRGRAGRQGDPGKSQFYLSLEDELMRRFGGEKLKGMMTTLNIPEDEPIQNVIITKVIESAQTKIEGFNFDIRKHVLDYDDVMNKQREVVYRRRRAVLETKDMRTETLNLLDEEFEKMIGFHTAMEEAEWNLHEMVIEMKNLFPAVSEDVLMKSLEGIRDDRSKDELEKRTMIREKLTEEAKKYSFEKEQSFGAETWGQVQKALLMRSIDTLWMNHLDEIDYLRQGIGLRGYGQRDPLVEYKREAFDLFMGLLDAMRKNYLMTVFKVAPTVAVTEHARHNIQLHGAGEDGEQFGAAKQVDAGHNPSDGVVERSAPIVSQHEVGRNDPCPCGSGKKYKKCHGK
jgi:preprotein translocase subunit SecA